MADRVTYYSVHKPSKKRLRRLGLVLAVILVGLFILTLYIRHIYLVNLKPVSNSQQSQLITIKSGDSLPKIASTLKGAGIIKSNWAFEWYVKNDSFARDDLQAGTYSFRPSQSVQGIVIQLTYGRIATNLVTILPGQRLDQVEKALVHDGFSQSSVTTALNPSIYHYPMLSGLPAGADLEGFLYPDSFDKTTTTQVGTIINESLGEMQSKLTPSIVAGFVKQGLSVYQGIILASIVEQEVSNPADKPIVAQVFLSRFHSGMNLGSDVTAYYGAIIAGQAPSVNYNSPYNTRLNPGLPPGPISNISESSLQAVANPANTSYLYFVTGDNGTTYFSQTLDEHNQQVQQYCHSLCND